MIRSGRHLKLKKGWSSPNLFLVINTEMALRRFNPLPLRQVYTELIDLTIELVEDLLPTLARCD